jgi:hypothetical protein
VSDDQIGDSNKMINDGGPAFALAPTASTMKPHADGGGNMMVTHYGMESGMSLRDYFAAAALKGLLASIQPNQLWSGDDVAVTCYRTADAMLKAREAKP